jgi:DGQHR domain-containing protein
MNAEFVSKRYGERIDLGSCLVGQNLNVLMVRGFSALDKLAVVSDADVFDQTTNPNGTQRNLKKEHARECLKYALTATQADPTEVPMVFPEILLNAREITVLELYDPHDKDQLIALDSYADPADFSHRVVGVRVVLEGYTWPKTNKAPPVSRVDGNHRLYGTDEMLERAANDGSEVEDLFPSVPFALLIGLDQTDEARLFRDINGEHEGMEVTHLTSLEYRITSQEDLKKDPKKLPLWIAFELERPGRAFEKMVFLGGSRKGVKAELGVVPPIRINTLRSAIATQLASSSLASTALAAEPDVLVKLLDHYWSAVKETFPEAWSDRKNYILLQNIGFMAFAKFGGQLVDRALNQSRMDKADFKSYLEAVKSVSLAREDYKGIAGAGGAAIVAQKLADACQEIVVLGAQAKRKLLGTPTLEDRLRKAEGT